MCGPQWNKISEFFEPSTAMRMLLHFALLLLLKFVSLHHIYRLPARLYRPGFGQQLHAQPRRLARLLRHPMDQNRAEKDGRIGSGVGRQKSDENGGGLTNDWTHEWTEWTDERRTNGWMDGQTNGWMDKQTDGWTNDDRHARCSTRLYSSQPNRSSNL